MLFCSTKYIPPNGAQLRFALDIPGLPAPMPGSFSRSGELFGNRAGELLPINSEDLTLDFPSAVQTGFLCPCKREALTFRKTVGLK